MKKLAAAALLVAWVGSAAFANGPLLPWPPMEPGYAAAPLPRAEIFFGRERRLPWLTDLDPARPAWPWNARCAYPTQRYFIEYLDAPDRASELFAVNFHRPIAQAIAAYRSEVRSGAGPLAE